MCIRDSLRPIPLNKVTTLATPVTTTTTVTPVTVGRGRGNPQMVQVKQEPPSPGNVNTPKISSTTTMVRRRKGRGKKTSTVNVLEAMPEEGECFLEVEEDDLEGSDSDVTELYEILADITGPE